MLTDTASLQEELRRLNTIVRLLADRNEELESELDRYRSAGPSGNEGGSDSSRLTPTVNMGGSDLLRLTPTVAEGGSNPGVSTPTIFSGGRNETGLTPSVIEGGSDPSRLTPTLNSGRRPLEVDTPSLAPVCLELRPVAPLPVRALAPLPSEDALLLRLKGAGMGNVHNAGVRRAARLLLWVARDTGPFTYTAIGERLRLSEDGVCKLVMSLRRRGLLERSGWQRLRLTGKTRALLEEGG